METAQQYCLRWNNYHSTLNHIFLKLWHNGTFVDVSLIVDGHKIDCHKIVLSACSTYFEKLLTEHSSHPHPLIVLHDVPFFAVESLVKFMYCGEINVSRDHITAFLRAAETLKVKGLADYPAITDFTKLGLLDPDFNSVPVSMPNPPAHFYPAQCLPESLLVHLANNKNIPSIPERDSSTSPIPRGIPPPNFNYQNNFFKRTGTPVPLIHPKKRLRQDSTSPLPHSPPLLHVSSDSQDRAGSPPQDKDVLHDEIKIEVEEETDNELQIDESVDQSPEESAVESDSVSSRNTPELDPQELRERHETAQSLAALASQGTVNLIASATQTPSPQLLTPLPPPAPTSVRKNNSVKIKKMKVKQKSGGKNGEKAYTIKDLEEGIENVISGFLTPAKAIAKYNIPRRTFFRRLSGVRKQRGIPSSKENAASENFLRSHSNESNVQGNGNIPFVVSGIVQENSLLNRNKITDKLSNANGEGVKKENSNQALKISTSNVLSLFGAPNPTYENYLCLLKFNQANVLNTKQIKRETTVDGNSNISSSDGGSDQALALVTQNGS